MTRDTREFLVALNAIVESAAAVRDSMIKNGFKRKDAIKTSLEIIKGYFKPVVCKEEEL